MTTVAPRPKQPSTPDTRASEAHPSDPPPPSQGTSWRLPPVLPKVAGGFGLVVAAVLATYMLIPRQTPAPASLAPEDVASASSPGPAISGDVEWQRWPLELPAGYVSPNDCDSVPDRWVLPRYSQAQLGALLDSVSLSSQQRSRIDASTQCTSDGCSIVPTIDLIEGLSPTARSRIYGVLGGFQENPAQAYPFRRNSWERPWSEGEGLTPETRDLLSRMSYHAGGMMLFADTGVACTRLTDPAQRVRMLEVLKTRHTIGAVLNLHPTDDLAALARNWGTVIGEGPALEVLRKAQAGSVTVNVSEFFAPWARKRVNTFPRRDEPSMDCFWTALHFREVREPHVEAITPDGFAMQLGQSYEQVPLDHAVFGDIVAFLLSNERPVHAAVFLARNLVFSKNGGSFKRPWTIESVSALREIYPEARTVRAYRFKSR